MKKYFKVAYIAPASLVLAMLGYFLTSGAKIEALKALHAFCEAAMVGGLADWFAVVALFRHPMGLPIPHTSIIKKNRRKMTAKIVEMLQNQWLTREAIARKISQVDFAAEFSAIILSDENQKEKAVFLNEMMDNAITALERSNIDYFKMLGPINEMIKGINFKEPMVAAIDNNFDNLKSSVLTEADHWLLMPDTNVFFREKIRQIVLGYAEKFEIVKTAVEFGETLGVVNYESMARELIKIMTRELEKAKNDPEHEICIQLRKTFDSFLNNMKNNEKIDAMPNMLFGYVAGRIDFKALVPEVINGSRGDIVEFLSLAIGNYGKRLAEDKTVSDRFNSWTRDKILTFLEKNHSEIGKIVKENIDGINDDDLAGQIEDKVGEDLQYIRINGAIVGGLVGVVIYVIKNMTAMN